MNKKPIIGLIAKHANVDDLRTDSFIRDEMKDAIFYNGGIAVGILNPSKEIILTKEYKDDELLTSKQIEEILISQEKEDLITQIKLCDGLILSGGLLSDLYEIWVEKYAHENNIPLLAICAGQNNFIKALVVGL